jgi:hypothetical protein
MKIRFTAPTAEMPFFHNVKVQTAKGWQKIIGNGSLGWGPAVFPNQSEMVAAAKRVGR